MFFNGEADLLLNYDSRLFPALCHEADRLGLAARTVAGAPASITVSAGNPPCRPRSPLPATTCAGRRWS